jgi:hypothetical protein
MHVKGLKETGAGLRPEDVTPGSEIANSIGFFLFPFAFTCFLNSGFVYRKDMCGLALVDDLTLILERTPKLQPYRRPFIKPRTGLLNSSGCGISKPGGLRCC